MHQLILALVDNLIKDHWVNATRWDFIKWHENATLKACFPEQHAYERCHFMAFSLITLQLELSNTCHRKPGSCLLEWMLASWLGHRHRRDSFKRFTSSPPPVSFSSSWIPLSTPSAPAELETLEMAFKVRWRLTPHYKFTKVDMNV